jgi:hypothetical protein
LELPAFRAGAELDRSAEFLLALAGGAVVRLPAFEFWFTATLLLADSGAALGLLTFEFLFAPRAAVAGVSRPAFVAIEELAPATVNTTSSRLPRCST